MSTHYDAIIVGSGAGGGTAARVLTQRGLRVAVLEKGGLMRSDEFLPYDELHFSEHKVLTPDKEVDPMVYVETKLGVPEGPDTPGKNFERWWIGNMVGGATMLWEANLPRYTAEDFSLRNFMVDEPEGEKTSQVNWPWTYDEFQPWFEMAEREWGVSGAPKVPMPPVRPHASTPFLTEAFAKFEMALTASPRGINTRTYNSRPACPYCGFCQGYGCAVNDRASSTNTVLAAALATGRCTLLPGHYVTRLEYTAGPGRRISGVEYVTEPNGPRQHLTADRVFVSIQAIESARLFLLSGIGDLNPLVGRYLTYHTKGSSEFTFKNQPVWDEGPGGIYQPRTSIGSVQLRHFYTIRDKQHPELTKGGKFSVYDPFTVSPLIKCVTKTGWLPKKAKDLWGRDLVDRLVELRNQGGVSFSFTGETMSMYDNRVELDKTVKDPWGVPVARTYYHHHSYDIEISKYCLNKVNEVMVDAGGELRKYEPQSSKNEWYGHNHGTLRSGTDRELSVLDSNCQSHDVKGLYVLDSAFMPTAGASNPTLTQIANAYRVCHSLPL